ncbi:hypothetical protein Tco_0897282 [Tanacetum coccineum]
MPNLSGFIRASVINILIAFVWSSTVTAVSGSCRTTKLTFKGIQDLILWAEGHFQNPCSKLVSSKDKEVNMAVGDSDVALVCCVENTVADCIMDSKELERFKLRSGKVRLANDKTLNIASVGDVVLKTSFGTSWNLKDVRCTEGRDLLLLARWFGEVEEAFLYDVREDKEILEQDLRAHVGAQIRARDPENGGSFEDSERSDEEYSEDRASSKEGGSETPQRMVNRFYSEALSSKESVQWKGD